MIGIERGAERETPYGLVFGDEAFEAELFPAIAAELEGRSHAAADPAAFVMLGSVGRVLRSLRPDAPEGGQPEARDAVLHYGALTYQAFLFWRAGKPLYTVPPATLDALLGDAPAIGEWALAPPAEAGYVQLPRHRVWIAGGEDTPEAVDGFFWSAPAGQDASRRLDIVLCAGLRPGRPGFAAFEVAASLPAEAPGHWGDIRAREQGRDFENVLPGGEIGGLFALTNAAEVLKLVSRTFHAMTDPSSDDDA